MLTVKFGSHYSGTSTAMASTSQINTQKDSFHFSSVLASSVYEWLLMFLLFLDALFSYLVTKFAHLFKLQSPCLLCSRLDHIFGNEKPRFYRDLICDSHKSEISSLVYCHVHRKLADANEMCEGCLLSFASDKKPNLESSNIDTDLCSCCSVPLRKKSHADSLVQINTTGVDVVKDLSDRSLKLEPVTIIPNNLSTCVSDDTEVEKSVNPTFEFDSFLSLPDNHLLHVDGSNDVPPITIGHETEEARNINPLTLSETTTQECSSEFSNGKCELLSTASIGDQSKPLSSTETIENDLPGPTPMDLNDAYKLAIGSKSRLPSPTVTEVLTGRDSSKVYSDQKLLISQFSASRGLESPWNDLSPSPRVLGQGDESKFTDASSSAILHNITNSLSIERNESGFESLDGSIVSEIEGENAVDRLKRQVELDRKSIYLLYKELEEERSASAIAANQAMAMINKLQGEKAVMQMEALHYQRLMEEQAEYDQEALQRSNELLSQKAEEVQNLKDELGSYRKRFGDGLVEDSVNTLRDDNVRYDSFTDCLF